ncbi:oxidoreductase [Sporosarcina sp. P37]|uniref:NAD(P)/FAD-dependent oxidoreductase n=1 Tax=unclassified Sporosarcina TaxID=2647733 RepID=UPI0009BEBC12|nr:MULTISPECIES: FAD-dependent oxidoreductase [unclassified Sporosarcina]ARD49399.1 oxidoreductase [Sporosarcina sp. P33]ARK25872.1 oxidoreductase [Sporosarcina sp. P37]PID19103.1 FAD-binding oxidoreductase [Sporosarcina sp. P35]
MKKVLIIGAGIAGVSAAYHLSAQQAEVVLVDRQEPGQATKAAAGIICPWASQRRNKAWYALASAGAAYYPELIRSLEEQGEMETGYKKVGALAIHTDVSRLEKKVDLLHTRREQSPEIGEVELLEPGQAAVYFPVLSEDYSAVRISGAAKVEGDKLREALERVAVKRGVQLIRGSATPYAEDGEVRGVMVNGEIVKADQIIVAAGAWAGEFTEPLGKKLQVAGQKAQILHLQSVHESSGDWPVIMPPSTQYLVPFQHGRFVAGATHEDTDHVTIQSTAGGIMEILANALPIAPALREAELAEVRVGIRPHTPNFMPVIGQLPDHPQVWVVNGLGSSGLTVGPLLGKLLSKLVLGEETGWNLESYAVEQIIEDAH